MTVYQFLSLEHVLSCPAFCGVHGFPCNLDLNKQKNVLFIYFFNCSGLLSEKSDDTLFFLDVGQPKKVEQKGKYQLKMMNYFPFD